MSTPAQDIQEAIAWLATLDSKNLYAEISLDDNEASFGEDNWKHMPDFFKAYPPESYAQIILQRKEATIAENGKNHQTLMGAEYFSPSWEILSANFLRNLNHIDAKTKKVCEGDKEIIFVNLNEEYPDSPIARKL